jgi:hypothetical protein
VMPVFTGSLASAVHSAYVLQQTRQPLQGQQAYVRVSAREYHG